MRKENEANRMKNKLTCQGEFGKRSLGFKLLLGLRGSQFESALNLVLTTTGGTLCSPGEKLAFGEFTICLHNSARGARSERLRQV
jgi:hypothetical protein